MQGEKEKGTYIGKNKQEKADYLSPYTTCFIIWRRCFSVDNVMSLKSYDHTCNNTLTRTSNVIYNVRVNNAFSY